METNMPSTRNMSLFVLMKHSKTTQYPKNIKTKLTLQIDKVHCEYAKIMSYISLLQAEVITPFKKISQITSALEFSLASGNNDTNITQMFYMSKLFIELVNAINAALPEYRVELLTLMEKILSNKYIAKYLAQDLSLISKIFSYLSSKEMFECSIKVIEILLMNSCHIVPISQIYPEIVKVYTYTLNNNILNSFCRILAILLFDYKKMEFKQIFRSKDHLKIKPIIKTISENQSICLNLNEFLRNILMSLGGIMEKTKQIAYDSLSSRRTFTILIHGSDGEMNYQIPSKSSLSKQDEMIGRLTYGELTKLIQLNIFQRFKVDEEIEFLKQKKVNVYNTYSKMIKIISTIQSKSEISEDRRKFVTIIKFKTYQIEMLFVLSTLLGSKRKIEIQDKLAQMNIVDILSSYLEYMEWGNIFSENKRPIFNGERINLDDDSAFHGEGCFCDIDTAIKIQYLRIIYTYCCRDKSNIDNKMYLLSNSDLKQFTNNGYYELANHALSEFKRVYECKSGISFNNSFNTISKKINKEMAYKEKDKPIENILLDLISLKYFEDKINYYNCESKKIGLLQKLIYKYIQECYYSTAKFWLASCIEVFLRGNNTFYQTFILSSGLVPCLLYDILYAKSDQNQILQFSFDILGELMKFNRGSFFIINYYLDDNNEFNDFFQKATKKETLIDSNVFLRSIIISNYYFDKHDQENQIPQSDYFTSKCRICNSISRGINHIFLSLISIVKPHDINQTNISCINSSLLILIIEHLKGTLQTFLTNLKQLYPEESQEGLSNFRKLILMWKDFYNYRPKDSASLQHSTTISFHIWQQVTSILLEEDE